LGHSGAKIGQKKNIATNIGENESPFIHITPFFFFFLLLWCKIWPKEKHRAQYWQELRSI
jgi:hypothetical protein